MKRAVGSGRAVPLEGECPHPRAAPERHLSPPPSCPPASTGAPPVPAHTSCPVQANSDCWGKRTPAGASLIGSSSPASGMQHLGGFGSTPAHAPGSLSTPHARSLLSSRPRQRRVPCNPPGSACSPPVRLHPEPCSTAPWPQPTPVGAPPAAGGAEPGAPRAGMLRGDHAEQEGGGGYLRSVLAMRAEGTGSPRAGGLRVHPLFPWQRKNGESLSATAAGKGRSGCTRLQGSTHPKNPSDGLQMRWVLLIPPLCSYEGAGATRGCPEPPRQAIVCGRARPQSHPRPRAPARAPLWAALRRNPHRGGGWISPALLNLPAEIPSGDSPGLLGSGQRPWQVPSDASSCRWRGAPAPARPPGLSGAFPTHCPAPALSSPMASRPASFFPNFLISTSSPAPHQHPCHRRQFGEEKKNTPSKKFPCTKTLLLRRFGKRNRVPRGRAGTAVLHLA